MYIQLPLFGSDNEAGLCAPDAIFLGSFTKSYQKLILNALQSIIRIAPFRHIVTPGGYHMSVAMTICRSICWVTDHNGYRYVSFNPECVQPWPPMPEILSTLATLAAQKAETQQGG
jgi:alkylated DNA repair protein (DNA oxidative demethylase)